MRQGRRLARALLAESIYRSQIGGEDPREAMADAIQRLGLSGSLAEFLERLVKVYVNERARIAELMSQASERWPLERMLPLDRAIIAGGVAEMLLGETPYRVVISEAVELAKMYSTEKSGAFVNGVLDRVAGLLGFKEEAKL